MFPDRLGDAGERNSEIALLRDTQGVEHELAHAIHMTRRARYNFLHTDFGQRREGISPVIRIRTTGHPAALLKANHNLRHAGLTAVALGGQVTEAKGELWGHGEAGKNAVFVVRRLGVVFQLPIEQRRVVLHRGTTDHNHYEESSVKAIRYHQFGGTDVLRTEEVELPVPGLGQVLVKVAATSFNPVDDHIRQGLLAEAIPTPFPVTPCLDVAGAIVKLGEGVTGFQIDDRVIGMFPLNEHGGAAEYAVIAAELLAMAPRTLPLADAAALPLTGLAARQASVELASIQAGQSVLVNGAGGAVGSFVVQLAADAGATVTAVDGPKHADRLLEHGAAKVVGPLDLDAGPSAVGGPFDVVINHVRLAPEGLAKLTAYVADGGIAVSSAGAVPADGERSVRSASVWVTPNGSHLADMVSRLDQGRIKLNIVDRRPLQELRAVHEEAGIGTLLGKTILTVS